MRQISLTDYFCKGLRQVAEEGHDGLILRMGICFGGVANVLPGICFLFMIRHYLAILAG